MWRGTEEPDDGRIAVVQLRHGIEEVRDETRAAAYGCRRNVCRRNAKCASTIRVV